MSKHPRNHRPWESNGLTGHIENPGTPYAKLVLDYLSQQILEYENVRSINEQERANVEHLKNNAEN